MTVFHRYTPAEIGAATGLSSDEVAADLERFGLAGKSPPPRGGSRSARRAALSRRPSSPDRLSRRRHPSAPRVEGQRLRPVGRAAAMSSSTSPRRSGRAKAPHASSSIWPTRMSPPCGISKASSWNALEWTRKPAGVLSVRRNLPNGVSFGAEVTPTRNEVRMELWITNGTQTPLSGSAGAELRDAQGGAGLRSREPMTTRSSTNRMPPAAVRTGTAGSSRPGSRAFAPGPTPPCPCLHSDPQFPDCAARPDPAHPRLALVLRGPRRSSPSSAASTLPTGGRSVSTSNRPRSSVVSLSIPVASLILPLGTQWSAEM